MAANEPIHVVIAGGIVFDAYRHPDSAELHARVLTGGKVVSCMLRDAVPPVVLDDIASDFDRDNDDETPVDIVTIDKDGHLVTGNTVALAKPSRRDRATDPRFDLTDIHGTDRSKRR